MSHVCHRPASLGHKEQSSGVSHAHRPTLGEKWKIHFNQIEVTRHPAPKNSGCKANVTQRVGAKSLLLSLGSQGSSVPLQGFSCTGCASWHPRRWLLSPPCPSPCGCSPCNARLCPLNGPATAPSLHQELGQGCVSLRHGLGSRNSFPEMHVRLRALVTFRNVPLPRVK